MKKFVLRVMAVMMVAAMTFTCVSKPSVALAADEAVTLDLATKGSVISGEAPADNADGSLTFSGGVSMKCSFPLPATVAAGETVKVNVSLKFNSEADAGVRFYLINGVDVNTATGIEAIANENTGDVVEKTFVLTAASDSSELLFASSGYGINIDNVTLLDITLGDKPAEAPADSNLVTLDLSQKGSVVSGEEPTANADGSLTFSGGVSMKYTFPLPETLAAGESVKVNATIKFDSAADAGVRFYLINGVDVNIAEQIAQVANDGSGVVDTTFELKATADATELLFASASYGVYLDNVTLVEISLGDKPVAETPKDDKPAIEVTGDEYVIQAGDTLREIAKACGLTVQDLVDANKIENPNLIRKGATLVIPTVDTAKRHVVVKGDTLS
ncbi:MAG: LysM peptidoglycan-binding domain-containing protein, partial [Clostridia bacterium]|nr:LysM peptidoglycan-binding domain-containing protein [Clostridia bacterium]